MSQHGVTDDDEEGNSQLSDDLTKLLVDFSNLNKTVLADVEKKEKEMQKILTVLKRACIETDENKDVYNERGAEAVREAAEIVPGDSIETRETKMRNYAIVLMDGCAGMCLTLKG